MSMGAVDRMDQNILAYMFNVRTKKWWWPLFRFVVDVSVNNAYQIYHQSHLNPGEYRLDVLGVSEPLWMRPTVYTERGCRLQHYSQVVAAYISLQTIFSLTVSITGLQRAHNNRLVYQDVKEPRHIIAKNAILVFTQNVLNYITVSRAVCKVYLR